jgi:hypothetical protein
MRPPGLGGTSEVRGEYETNYQKWQAGKAK